MYKRQALAGEPVELIVAQNRQPRHALARGGNGCRDVFEGCLLYTSDAADERSSVDLGGRRIIKKKKKRDVVEHNKNRQKTVQIKNRTN